jgi:hypothetical protein
MARNQSDFTDEQRAAVVNAVLLDGMATRAAADAAQAGTLDGVEAFQISRSSVSAFAREALAERNVEPGGHDSEIRRRLDALGLELLAMAEDVLGELEDAEGERDVGRMRQVAGLLKTIRGTLALGPGGQAQGAQPGGLLERLAAEAESAPAGSDNGNS